MPKRPINQFSRQQALWAYCLNIYTVPYLKQSPPLFWIFVWHFWKATYRQYLLLDHENDFQNVPQKLFHESQLQTRPELELRWSTCHLRFFSWLGCWITWFISSWKIRYRISTNSFRGNYSVLNLEIVENSNTVLLHIVSSETILFWIWESKDHTT